MVFFQNAHFPREGFCAAPVFMIARHIITGIASADLLKQRLRVVVRKNIVEDIAAQQDQVGPLTFDRRNERLRVFTVIAGMQIR